MLRPTLDLFPEWQLIHQLGPQEGAASIFTDRILSMAFSPDGSRLAAGGGEASRSGELTIWKTADWTLERTIEDAAQRRCLRTRFFCRRSISGIGGC